MPSSQFSQNTITDFLFSFENGMNSGVSPLLLSKNQLAWGSNLTTRGTLIHPRPARVQYTLDLSAVPTLASAIQAGTYLFQGRCFYKPDAGTEVVMASISGRLYKFNPDPVTHIAVVTDVTGGNPQSSTALQCWLWQAENYVIWNDGINLPVFFDGTTTTRSRGNVPPAPQTFTTAALFSILPSYNGLPPTNDTLTILLTTPYTGSVNDNVSISGASANTLFAVVTAIGVPAPNNVTLRIGIDMPQIQQQTIQYGTLQPLNYVAGSVIQTLTPNFVPQFPIGRMGGYGRGRVWMSLANGKDFIAGDIVRGPSGTKALDFRDAVLNVTENNFLTGGGTFTIPGSFGDIRSITFTAELDASLGQGPLQIFTPTHVFSCAAPIDRLQWQSITNPILTVSAIGNGGLGQDNTFLVNSDTIYRAVDGIRSLILSRQDFNTWVRTPISHEVERVLNRDNQSLLAFGSGAFFDNRILMTVSPVSTSQGVHHQAIVALNNDLISTVREKSPPAYDGAWPGMNVFSMVTGNFSAVERCFQFVFNTVLQTLELWELLPSQSSEVENNPNTPVVGDQSNGTSYPIEWWFESSALFRDRNPGERTYKQLNNGELMVDKLVGRVDFEVFYKPDQFPCWTLWHSWSECATQNTGASTDTNKAQFRPRMGLGTPSGTPCDPTTNRPMREGFTFQIKVVATGQCEITGMRFEAVVKPLPTFAPLACDNIC